MFRAKSRIREDNFAKSMTSEGYQYTAVTNHECESSLRFTLYLGVLILVILVTDSRKTRFNYLHSMFNSILILLGSCGSHIYAPFYTHFHSPGYPDCYPNNVVCTWLIEAPPGFYIQLHIYHFNLEYEGKSLSVGLLGNIRWTNHVKFFNNKGVWFFGNF